MNPSPVDQVIDLVPTPMPEPEVPAAVPSGVRSSVLVPLATHTHPYPVAFDHDAYPHDPSLVHVPLAPQAPRPPVAPEVVVAPEPRERFKLVIANSPHQQASGAGAGAVVPESEPGGDAAPIPEEGASTRARLASPMRPAYPVEARAQEVEADVLLEFVVTTTGTVADARIVKSVGMGFEQSALAAARAARFVPAERDGRPVAVRMRWTMTFRLQ
jgi:TonB family protein